MFYQAEDEPKFVRVIALDRLGRINPNSQAGYLIESCGGFWHRMTGAYRMSRRRYRLMDRLAREGWHGHFACGSIDVGMVYNPETGETRALASFGEPVKRCQRTGELPLG